LDGDRQTIETLRRELDAIFAALDQWFYRDPEAMEIPPGNLQYVIKY